MKRANRSLFFAACVVALMTAAADGQGRQGERGGPPAAPPAGAGRGFAPAMTMPKALIPNAKPVRSCESLATVALVANYKGGGSTDDAANFTCSTGF